MSKDYFIKVENNRLMFSTTSFKAEKGSVLHSGIYNRELASSLAAGACIIALGFFFASNVSVTVIHYIAMLPLFAILFLAFRTYLFREPVLQLVIDKKTKKIGITVKRAIGRRAFVATLHELEKIRQGYTTETPANPDGIQLVEKIALQHGTVIPDFGTTAEFHTVELEFRDGRSITIFSSGAPGEADDIAHTINHFIERE
ncbi:MAG: hypothetical protein AB1553_10860 [Nitrospirota bacterium]